MSIDSEMPYNHLVLCCPLLLRPPSFPASGSFLVSQLFASGGQSIGASASVSVLPMNIQGWFPLELTGLIFLMSRGLLSVLQHHNSKASILCCPSFFMENFMYCYFANYLCFFLLIIKCLKNNNHKNLNYMENLHEKMKSIKMWFLKYKCTGLYRILSINCMYWYYMIFLKIITCCFNVALGIFSSRPVWELSDSLGVKNCNLAQLFRVQSFIL